MYLVAGLGNPGDIYKNTRHNIGFMVIDNIIHNNLDTTNINKVNFKSELFKIDNFFLAKPKTFMNNSGEALYAISNYYNINISNIIIIHDDLDLPFGTVKFKLGGGNGGHNGLKSIDSCIGKEYIRIRIGIGKPQTKIEVSKYVLSKFSTSQIKSLDCIINHVTGSIKSIQKMPFESFKSKFTLKSTG